MMGGSASQSPSQQLRHPLIFCRAHRWFNYPTCAHPRGPHLPGLRVTLQNHLQLNKDRRAQGIEMPAFRRRALNLVKCVCPPLVAAIVAANCGHLAIVQDAKRNRKEGGL